jgi:hypothetical protein
VHLDSNLFYTGIILIHANPSLNERRQLTASFEPEAGSTVLQRTAHDELLQPEASQRKADL